MIEKSFNFKVKGTSFKNEDNIDIQTGIKKVLREYKNNDYFSKQDLYGGYTNQDIKEMNLNISEYEGQYFGGKIELSSYKDKPCFKVYISTYGGKSEFVFHEKEKEDAGNYLHIGFIPNELVDEVLQYWNDKDTTKYAISIEIIGGKYKHSEMDDEDFEKEKIVIEELTYGFEVDLVFHNDKENEYKTINEQKENISNEVLEQYKKEPTKHIKEENKLGVETTVNIILCVVMIAIFTPIIWLFVKFFHWILTL